MTISITADSASALYHQALLAIENDGLSVSPRGKLTKEILGATLILTDASRNIVLNPWRKLNYRFMAAEFCWIASGSALAEHVVPYNSQLAQFSDNGITFLGAYGPMWIEQMPYVLDSLVNDRESRQAVVSIWRGRPGPSLDIPCTLSWQFIVRDNAVHMIATMRSNDAWLGLPYDMFNFTMIQRLVASILGLRVGSYIHNVGSLHLYEEHFGKVPLMDATEHPKGVIKWENAPSPGTLMNLLSFAHTLTPTDKKRALDQLSTSIPKYWRDLVPLMIKVPASVDDEQVRVIMTRWSLSGVELGSGDSVGR